MHTERQGGREEGVRAPDDVGELIDGEHRLGVQGIQNVHGQRDATVSQHNAGLLDEVPNPCRPPPTPSSSCSAFKGLRSF